jgi:hypothetical protein
MDHEPVAELEREDMTKTGTKGPREQGNENGLRRISTRVVVDMETGAVLERESLQYCGPVALCDRSVQNAASTAASTEGTQASGIGSYMTPLLESWAGGNAPGYGQGAVNQMTAAAQTAAGSASNAAQQGGLLRALRTGNAAGVAAGDVAGAVGAGQNQTQAVEDILSQNAQLKAQQQTGALNMLGSLYGTDVTGQTNNLNTQLKAGQSGWLQQWGGPLLSTLTGVAGIG